VLRSHGVRFGAHHIYVPTLLKPAPRALAAQLWALKHGGLQQKGLDELPHLAASGRTSIPVDPEIQKGLYRAVGFRVAGERAVRVDILERLADLIRPALAWRPNSPGEKPAGAFDGNGFIATVAMTSLAGCAGEDFASILRSLGYRMERRPAPVEAAPAEAAPAAEASAVEAAAEVVAETAAEAVADVPVGTDVAFDQTMEPALEEVAASEPATEAAETVTVDTTAVSGEVFADPVFDHTVEPALEEVAAEVEIQAEPVEAETAPEDVPAEAAVEEVTAETVDATETVAEVSGAEEVVAEVSADAPDAEAASTEAAPAEPAMIEVWRPGRPPGQHRPAHQRKGGNQGNRDGAQQGRGPRGEARTDAAAGAPAEGGRPEFRRDRPENGGRRPPRDDQRRERRPEGEGAQARGDRRDDQRQGNRPPRQDRGDRQDRNRPDNRQDRQDRFASRPDTRNDSRRDKPVDPDSPFAALLALKARMEAEKNGG
jgi:ATP-dependent RNA helicase SUPV3L1/SUV3